MRRRRAEGRPKVNMKTCKVTLTSVHNPNSTDWYFVSGCSRHMTENASFFSELRECNAGSAMFGDGGKGRIISLPALTFDTQGCCFDCPVEKQIKSSHRSTTHHTTSRTLELLYIDLMGPMEIESLGGKRYAMNSGIVRNKVMVVESLKIEASMNSVKPKELFMNS
ncbi:gag-pol polyprotein [Cucumis melo var. makuwa]|uniref:Gag-pol polyprotein n=1 Tax=Cucumis melo var. makuwa TaxID=1194695 RepID=A0A5A7TXK7_CUCMM|nr:gag-pol polyprotein [Cucumis melo var. makuwa]